jgi:TDG/mug DNA glycosylase family protein
MAYTDKPSKTDLRAAVGKSVADVIAPGLRVLFCGINPGLYSAAVGHHFARPGNRFWPALHAAGFSPRLLRPEEERELLQHGYGITNVVERATATANELSRHELVVNRQRLEQKVQLYRPAHVAVLGVAVYRITFGQPKAAIGRQNEMLSGAAIWVLPNPSGLNAHYQAVDFARLFRELQLASAS